MSDPKRGFRFVLAGLALAGLFFSAELTRIHYLTHTDPSYEALCAVSDKVNCETVALSPYSVRFGLPVSLWGMLTYLGLLLLALWGIPWRKREARFPTGFFLAASAGSVAVSAALAYISVTRIASICLFCNALYLVNLALLALSILWLRKSGSPVRQVLKEDFVSFVSRPWRAGALLAAVTVVVLAVLLWVPRYWAEDEQAVPGLAQGVTSAGEPWIGAAATDVTIEEFTDYECPFCRRAHRTMRGLLAAQPGRIRLVHRHYPLDQGCNRTVERPFHLRACEFSLFTFCAGEQGRFWEANDAVFDALDRVRSPAVDLKGIAARIGVDWTNVDSCMKGGAAGAFLRREIEEGIRLGVRGTPTYFIGGEAYQGMVPPQVIEAHLGTFDSTERSEIDGH